MISIKYHFDTVCSQSLRESERTNYDVCYEVRFALSSARKPRFDRPSTCRLRLADATHFAVVQQNRERGVNFVCRQVSAEQVHDIGTHQAVSAGRTQRAQDGVGSRVASCVAEDMARRRLAKSPHRQCGVEMNDVDLPWPVE